MTWSFRNIVAVAERSVAPDRPALIHGGQVTTWGALKARSDALAAAFAAAAPRGAKVAHYMRNSPAYLETAVAAFKAGMVHVNVNYRYVAGELLHIFDNSDAAIIVYAREFAPQIAQLRDRLGKVVLFVEAGDGAPANAFATPYEALAASGAAAPPDQTSEDDYVFIYTGGTTGLPKGVMWRQLDMWKALGGGGPGPGMPGPDTIEAFEAQVRAAGGGPPVLICPPLMHGAGFMIALTALFQGGAVITLPGAAFDANAALDAARRWSPRLIAIVGDAFARPLARALDTRPAGDLAAVMMLISSGAVWSPEVKAAIARHAPGVMLMDSLGSSEVLGMGASMTTAADADRPTRFLRDPRTRVIADDGTEVAPGSGAVGRIHRGGPAPVGYYKDEEKTARTFVTLDGQRYVVPGDYATVEADGAIRLIGRGAQVINTGGEKVFVEEVEEALKSHPAVDDALVFGVPDPTWGQAVTAVVEAHDPVGEAALIAHVRGRLAAYKAPKRIVFAPKAPRGPNGKADYAAARALAGAGA